jgi:hypothetical protein
MGTRRATDKAKWTARGEYGMSFLHGVLHTARCRPVNIVMFAVHPLHKRAVLGANGVFMKSSAGPFISRKRSFAYIGNPNKDSSEI